MLYKVKYADRSYYSQRNNPIDTYNQITGKSGYLESCMTSALTNACVALMEKEPIFKINDVVFQPEQLAWDMLNDKGNWPELMKLRNISEQLMLREGIVPSRVPQYMPFVSKKLFNIESSFCWLPIDDMFNKIGSKIVVGNSVVIQLMTPAHYIAVLKYDSSKEVLIYNDSAYGKNLELTREDIKNNVDNFYVEFEKKE